MRKIRKASIPLALRDTFERYGEHVIGNILASGHHPAAQELHGVYGDVETKKHARDWLTERADFHELREQRLELVEWAIFLLVGCELLISITQVIGWLPNHL